jgi:hypothetical protein
MGEDFGSPEQGLREGTGTWAATSWSYESDGLEGEVYFNYDLRGARAEIAGTTAESDSDALEAIATAVRDGPRPPRSQVNDPNFTNDGPKVVDVRLIPDSLMTTAGFAPGGRLLILWNRKASAAVSAITLDDSRDRTTLARFDGAVNFVICADANANSVIVDENAGSDSLAFGGNATHRIWWINRTTGTRNQITGPWGSRGYAIGNGRLSPDGRYLAISSLSGTVLDQNRVSNLFLVDMRDGKSVQANGDNLFPMGWRGIGGDLRELVRHFLRTGSKTLAVDPQTGNVTPISSESDSDRAVSPDGQWKFVVQPNVSVTFEPIGGGQNRIFTFSEVDRRFALPDNISWLGPRYLRFSMTREGFIDLATMKMGYLPTVDGAEDGPVFQFSSDFRWALFHGKDGVSLGRVVAPGARPVATDH